MPDPLYNVLFLCTANSARSIIAETILNARGQGRFRAFPAGSHPGGTVHPMALHLLERQGHDTAGLRSKSWDEWATPGAPPLDFVFTVCDNAAGEVCPIWPGQPMTAHWGLPDPDPELWHLRHRLWCGLRPARAAPDRGALRDDWHVELL
ncbi:MAG: arsenate reductase ArsC [Qingshengfaniella sp.]